MVLSDSLEAILTNDGYATPAVRERLPEFAQSFQPARFTPATDSGVTIGMTKRQTRNILGPPHRNFYSQKFRADEFVYTHTTKKTADGLSGKYTNYYLFKNDRLFFIELRYDLIGGG